MGGSPLGEATQFLISTIFGIYIIIVALRFLLQVVRADFYNPLSQFVVKATTPPLRILRRFIPGYAGIDWPSIVLLVSLQMLEIFLLTLVGPGGVPALPGLFVISVSELFRLIINIFTFAIIIQIVISWVNPGAYNPITVLLYKLTEPLLAPARRYIPPMGGIDFSPMAVLIILQLLIILFINPLALLGAQVA
jgi:YggT family protein